MPKISVEYEQAQRERILDGAAQSFADKGYNQTSIDDIARNLGLSKGAIYIYFKSKKELFIAVFEFCLAYDKEIFLQQAARPEPVLMKLERVLDAYISNLFSTDPVRSRLLLQFWLESPHMTELQELRKATKQRDNAILVKLLKEGQLSGEVRSDVPVEEVVEVITATCEGLMLNYVTGCSTLSRAGVKRAVWNTFALAILPIGQIGQIGQTSQPTVL